MPTTAPANVDPSPDFNQDWHQCSYDADEIVGKTLDRLHVSENRLVQVFTDRTYVVLRSSCWSDQGHWRSSLEDGSLDRSEKAALGLLSDCQLREFRRTEEEQKRVLILKAIEDATRKRIRLEADLARVQARLADLS